MLCYINFLYHAIVHNHEHPNISALVFYDAPYNELKQVDWEYQITEQSLTAKMKQVNAIHHGNWQIFAIMHKPPDTAIVKNALEANGFCQLIQFYWYKGKEHQTKTPVSSYTNSVEMGTIGFMPNRKPCGWQMGTDPRHRHNHFEHKGVTKYYKYDNGEIINPCQKPPALLRWLCNNHLMSNSNVLIIGAGSGADIIGATQACCNVVAVERDDRQFEALQTTLVKYASAAETAAGLESTVTDNEGDDDDEKDGATENSQELLEEGAPKETKCPECKGILIHEKGLPRLICSECPFPAPLHPGCAQKMSEGVYLCLGCYQKGLDDVDDEEDGDEEDN